MGGFEDGLLRGKKEGEGWAASNWGRRLKRAVGMETPGGEAVHLPDSIKWEKDRGVLAEVVALARVAPKMVQEATARMVREAKAKMEEVAKNRRS
uniref:Uncharacterized protein n=1 Tax=Aegilops tauschii TaxID=37682 RepID=M8C7U0_AEGTA